MPAGHGVDGPHWYTLGMPEIGAKAPDFRVRNQDGQVVTLVEHAGRRVVLYFFPRANTPG